MKNHPPQKLTLDLENLDECFPDHLSEQQIATAKTLFFQQLSLYMHHFYKGKMSTIPKAGFYGFNWFNVWYTPGVASVSTTIRDDVQTSYELSNRENLVAVVSDSTRVLGDGDCGIAGGLGVMEGKAFLMKFLAGIDAVALCIDSRDAQGKSIHQKTIDFVNMLSPSFGAVNLEDISQPNCYTILDTLRSDCRIPVWHDDAQGTACVTLAGIINAVELADKRLAECRIVLLGAGSSNTTVARLLFLSGVDPAKTIIFDSKSGLHKNRKDRQETQDTTPHWQLCLETNPDCITDFDTAVKGADILIALSTPGPDIIKPYQIKSMNPKAIVFACANPVPEIYPYAAINAGAFIVATGRGDFPNQVNNSLGFPGILKGALLTHSTKITDNMAIAAANALALYAQKTRLAPDHILPLMTESAVYPLVAEAVALQAMKDGVALKTRQPGEVHDITESHILDNRKLLDNMMKDGFIVSPDIEEIQEIFDEVVRRVVHSTESGVE